MSLSPTTVTVTGAAGNIGYALLFRIASGQMLGLNTPIKLRLLEIEPALEAAEGVAMELSDSAFPLLASIELTADPSVAFAGTSVALLVGSMPRKAGMDRADLLAANANIFTAQGSALNETAADDVRVLVVGNPANTNALIASASAPDIPKHRFNAMMRLDHNRAVSQLAQRANTSADSVERLHVWGNHSNTQVPDVEHALIDGVPVRERIADDTWLDTAFVDTVATRGAAIIKARGASSAASAASAAIDHVHDWVLGTENEGWTTAAIPSDGSYGIDEGLIAGVPVRSRNGAWERVEGLELSDRIRRGITRTVEDLNAERDAVRALGISV